MKSLTWLLSIMLTEVGMRCSTDTSRDLKTISRRVKHEGESFLKIFLPDYSKDFEKSLATGRIDPNAFLGFKKRRGAPVFLGGLLDQVFDRESGVLLHDPSIEAIRCIRQICRMCGKIREPSSLEKERKCYEDYHATDNEVRDQVLETSYRDFTSLYAVFDTVFGRVCYEMERKLQSYSLVPKHGRGAVAERITGNGKYVLRTWPERLEYLFPADLYCVSNMGARDRLESINFITPEQEQPVRVISVPKTAKGPRIIAIEPVAMQYAQQALLNELVPLLEQDDIAKQIIRFTDQTVNQKLALQASKTGSHATIDLKDASDRVSLDIVRECFRKYPTLLEALEATRSTRANVPGIGVITLSKFASMGSALCFPIEAMVFTALTVSAILLQRTSVVLTNRRNVEFHIRNILKQRLSVYGDDIIVPVDQVLAVTTFLRKFGLKVNDTKTFGTGKFRESCGVDAYDGEDVTPCYVRHPMPSSSRISLDWCNLIDLRNRLYFAGYWETVRQLDIYITDNIGYIPIVADTSPGVGRKTCLNYYETSRYNKQLHRYEVKLPIICTRKRKDPLNGDPALLKFFLNKKEDDRLSSSKSKLDFERSPVARDTYIVRRWTTAY